MTPTEPAASDHPPGDGPRASAWIWRTLTTYGRRVFANADVLPLVLGCAIGLGGGLGAIAFRELVQGTSAGFGALRDGLGAATWIAVPATVALGGLLVGTITRFLAREVRGHGVPEVISALSRQRGVIRLRVVFAKAIASSISIGSGASVGREGPIVQIGAALGSTLGQLLRAPVLYMRIMVSCGAAAGISATFNAPFAGVLFSLEVISKDFRFRSLTPIVCSSVVATAVSRAYFGDVPAFLVPPLALGHPVELGFHVLLGITAGLVGVSFTRFLYLTEDLADRIRLPDPVMGLLGGLMVGLIALEFPRVMGVGYESIEAAILGTPELTALILLLLAGAKILATSLTLASGGSGGIFAPSLFIGAAVGAAAGLALEAAFPTLVTQPGAYALVGMGAVVSATTHAPLSAIVILFELTDDYKIILPLMLASVVSTVVAHRLCPDSIYTLKLSRRGETVAEDPATSVLAEARVRDAMSDVQPDAIREGASFASIVEGLKASPTPDLPVVRDGDGAFLGVVRFRSLKVVLDSRDLHPLLVAKDVCEENPDCLLPDEPLDEAFRTFQESVEQYIPVVSDGEDGRFLGFLSRADIIRHYRRLVEAGRRGSRPRA